VSWQDVYQTDAQGLWALIVVPALFLLWRAISPPGQTGPEAHAARFVHGWSLVFALETILDPIATGPLVRRLGVADGALGQVIVFLFVWLGDFRLFLLVLGVAEPARSLARGAAAAAAWSFVVPVVTFVVLQILHATVGSLPGVVMWLVYEAGVAALALAFRHWLVPARVAPTPAVRAYLRAVLGYAVAYYALWETADLLVLAGIDAGWALRIVPNQLYYAFFVPFAALAFERYVSTSASVQAAR
jgi:hypothetical protein